MQKIKLDLSVNHLKFNISLTIQICFFFASPQTFFSYVIFFKWYEKKTVTVPNKSSSRVATSSGACRVRNLKFATSKTLVNFMKKMMILCKNWYFSVQKAIIYYTFNKSHHNSFILLVFSHVANFRYVANFRFLTLIISKCLGENLDLSRW